MILSRIFNKTFDLIHLINNWENEGLDQNHLLDLINISKVAESLNFNGSALSDFWHEG